MTFNVRWLKSLTVYIKAWKQSITLQDEYRTVI